MLRSIAVYTLLLLIPIVVPVGELQMNWIPKGITPFKGANGQAVVGAWDNALGTESLFVARCHNVNQCGVKTGPIPEFWKCSIDEPNTCVKLDTDGLPNGAFRNGTAIAWDEENLIYALLGGRQVDIDNTTPQGKCRKDVREETGHASTNARCGFYSYNLSSDSWEKRADTPHLQGAGNAITHVKSKGEHYIYALLGSNQNSARPRSVLAKYVAKEDEWQWAVRLPEDWGECTDDGAALAWDNGYRVYILTGSDCDDNPSARFGFFDLQRSKFVVMHDLPVGVNDGGSLLYSSGTLYLITGGHQEEDKGSTPLAFYTYDTQADKPSWIPQADLDCPIGENTGNRLGLVNGRVVLWIGNRGGNCTGNELFDISLD